MANTALAQRVAQYIDADLVHVDISHCFPGAHARAIKPGGLSTITESIKENGYTRVRTLLFVCTNHIHSP